MQPRRKFTSLSAVALVVFAGAAPACLRAQSPPRVPSEKESPMRTWSTRDGRLFQAAFVDTDGYRVSLQPPAGKPVILPVKNLSAEDLAYLRAHLGIQSANPSVQGKPAPAKAQARRWPERAVPAEASLVVQQVQDPSNTQGFLYHSKSFEFLSQEKLAGSVMTEVVRTFEATRTLLEVLPWSIQPQPPADFGYYRAKLYADHQKYVLDGGPKNSSGVYSPSTRIFKIPFESLGLELRAGTWYKKPNFNNDTIIHEVTHQLMQDFLAFLPIWMVEGSAEYTAMIPFKAGVFECSAHDRGIKEYFKTYQSRTGGSFSELGPLLPMITMTEAEWSQRSQLGPKDQARLYASACLLVYFFCHLDGDGKGTRFIQYMEQIRGARDAWALFFKNPQVHSNADGSFSYPKNLALPSQARSEKYGIELVKLLTGGRDESQLARDFREGFQRIGIR